MKMENVLTKVYEEQEVAFRETNGQSEVRIDEVARFCGWVQIKNGKEYVRWETVNSFLIDLGFSHQVGKGDFIPEYIMYPLIGKANNDRATQFMLWVGKVLVEIRQNGAYVSSNITEEQELKLDKYSTSRKIRNTFKTCNLELIENEYRECMLYYKNKDGKEKNSIQNTIINVLNDRKQILIDNGKGSFALAIAEVTSEIIKKQKETGNKSRGQKISHKNKIISKLEGEILTLNPSIDEFMCFNIHPISENYV